MTEQRRRMLADGVVAGMVWYAMVVAFFALLDILAGRPPVHTATLLGRALFGGPGDPVVADVDATMVLAFNGVHLMAVLVFGFFAAWLVYETELHPELWYVGLFLFLDATLLGYALTLAVTVQVGGALSPWLMAVAALLASLAVAGYLAGSHRSLVRSIREMALAGSSSD